MAEEYADKTEAPTPRRRQEQRERGNIARSQDLNAAVMVLALVVLLKVCGPGLVTAMRAVVQQVLGESSFTDLSGTGAGALIVRSVLIVGSALAPLALGVVVVAVLVNVLQVGFLLSGKRLQPNLGALNPLRGLGKLFKGSQTWVHLGMNLLKVLLVAVVAWTAVQDRLGQIVTCQQLGYLQVFGLGAQVVWSVALRLGVLLLVLAIIDYVYQRFRVERELRMTKQEVREEMRQMDGDPKIKARRRQIALHSHLQRLRKAVPTADVIVTNPTEIAVALQYDAATMHAPKVVAKGQGHMAARIRELGILHGIPIIERKPLARALFKMVEVGGEIPAQLYAAVAEILAYVYELSGKHMQRRPPAERAAALSN